MGAHRVLNVGQGAEFANGNVIKLDDLDEEIYREPRTRGKRGSKMRREVLVQARVQFPDAMGKETIVTLALANTGSELVAIGGYELFQNIPLEDAPHPIVLVTAGKSRLKGGDKGVKVTVSVPVYTKNGKLKIFKCVDVFV